MKETYQNATPRLPQTSPAASPFFAGLAERILHRHRSAGWEGLVLRLVRLAEQAETPWLDTNVHSFLDGLRDDLQQGAFVPNSPLLRNAGNTTPHLFACFALDPTQPDFLQTARHIHDGMGGVGYPLDWTSTGLELDRFLVNIDDDTDAHQPGRPRPASNAATVSITHNGLSNMLERCGRMRNTNLNVGINHAFMERIMAGDVEAVTCLKRIADSIFRTGQPGVIFTDRIPRISAVETAFAANVCGEAPLAVDESGLLGSLNLSCFLTAGPAGWVLDESALQASTRRAVRFLDGMHDLHAHPTEALRCNSLATRKLGVGVMGFAHALALLGIRYGSPESEDFAALVGHLLWTSALEESENLGHARGVYPAWQSSHGPARRNACLVAIAGTATISLLVNASGGIEPIYAHLRRQRVIDRDIIVLDPVVRVFCEAANVPPVDAIRRLSVGEPLNAILPPDRARLLPTALEVTGIEHIRVQAAFQREIDGGITKTINCSYDTSREIIEGWLRLAWEEGLLGCTIYRDGTHSEQPMKSDAP